MKKRIIQYLSIFLTFAVLFAVNSNISVHKVSAESNNTLKMYLQDYDDVVNTLGEAREDVYFHYWKLPDKMAADDAQDTIIALHDLTENELNSRYTPIKTKLSFQGGYVSASAIDEGVYYTRKVFSTDKLIYNAEFIFKFPAQTGSVMSVYPKKVEQGEVKGEKIWDDASNEEGKRPKSIVIRLYRNGQEIDSRTVTAKDDWKWTFSGLSMYMHGVPVVYTITEDRVEGYTTIISGDAENGFVVKNSRKPKETPSTGDTAGGMMTIYGAMILIASSLFIFTYGKEKNCEDEW